MNQVRTFIIGVLVGGFMIGGGAYASETLQIEANFPIVSYWVDQKQVEIGDSQKGVFFNGEEDMPTTIEYKGTNYVPIRFIAEMFNKEVEWDGDKEAVILNSRTFISFERVQVEDAPFDVKNWLERSRGEQSQQVRIFDDISYILITGGLKSTGGYDAEIREIKQYPWGATVTYEWNDPPKGALVSQAMTQPYVLVKTTIPLQGTITFEQIQ